MDFALLLLLFLLLLLLLPLLLLLLSLLRLLILLLPLLLLPIDLSLTKEPLGQPVSTADTPANVAATRNRWEWDEDARPEHAGKSGKGTYFHVGTAS
jgi:hypothetical protein